MDANKTKCTVCQAEILIVTANRTGGKCMPCSNGDRYKFADYLSIENFFARTADDHGLAPNLEPHPTRAGFRTALLELRGRPGVSDLLIAVTDYEDPEPETNPCSDRIFVIGPVPEKTIAAWAATFNAEFGQEARPGAELPLKFSKGQPVWCVVWD